ncbi:Uncharacterized protein TCM_018762 [Theobroma cacao]|uniref:Uncharacterized protein n=1 Tax=Theobroma cacao TaxID=3641 RepID=A0A061EH25_THECC|nr:Uncharacterized protein TCM_018762 [Theobroma cacao]
MKITISCQGCGLWSHSTYPKQPPHLKFSFYCISMYLVFLACLVPIYLFEYFVGLVYLKFVMYLFEMRDSNVWSFL